jgi:protein SCO1
MWLFFPFTNRIMWSTLPVILLAAQPHSVHEHHPSVETSHSRSVASYVFPAVTLQDRAGRPFPLRSLDKYPGPLILQFIFTTCTTVCPIMSATLAVAQDKLGSDLDHLKMISITIDPETDTPSRLEEYARRYKARPQWIFLTGKEADIVAVGDAFRVYTGSKMRHQAATFLRASPGQPWVRMEGLMSAADLVAEYHKLFAK